ncbi:MAG TPA: ATP-binding protein [Miltoncostaeaceae bacterium]|nr:ATP-binding protein [Miltoncostaeaceae bacterium]
MSGRRAVVRAELPPDLRAPERGRAVVECMLRDAPAERAWDAEVLVSEVVTNAVLHGQPDADDPARLTVEADEARLRVEVQDGGPGVEDPTHEPPEPTATNGRGLAIVGRARRPLGVGRLPSRSGSSSSWRGRPRRPRPDRRPAGRGSARSWRDRRRSG